MVRTFCFLAVLAFLGTPSSAAVAQINGPDTLYARAYEEVILNFEVVSLGDTLWTEYRQVANIAYQLGVTHEVTDSILATVAGMFQYPAGTVVPIDVVVHTTNQPLERRFWVVVQNPTSVGPGAEPPKEFALHQNYPNPFNPTTTILYDLPQSATVRLTLYTTLGQEVATLVNEHQAAGTHRYTLSAAALPSGTYYYRLTANQFSNTKKILVLK